MDDRPGETVLTPEFIEALTHLDRGENLFLTGEAGTGKSTLIRTFLAQSERRALVVAPTGIAALNVEGYTIHRLFSFGKDTTVQHVQSKDYYPRRFAQALKELDILIIDEASMVRADLFDCIAVALERFGPDPTAPFGGVQIVLVGDLFQLPPVVVESENEYFATTYESPYFFSSQHYEPEHFPAVQLTRVFRQVGDSNFLGLLNQVRQGSMLDSARAELNMRVRQAFSPPLDEFWLTLTTTNRTADKRNSETLAKLPGVSENYIALVRGEFDGFDKPAEDIISFKTGAQIMMLTNDPADRWVNGTIGRISDHTFVEGRPLITVELADGEQVEVGPHTWDVTRPVADGGNLRHEVIGTFTQLPFKLAWAITIHKSQGQTLQRVVVDLTGGAFAYGQLYVALSRCTSLEGLVLTKPVSARDLQVDQRIRRFLNSRATDTTARRNVYLGVCVVGEEGRMWRPRPVEIALVTDEGHEISTLLNPGRDLGSARTDFAISATDIRLAPTLTQAWSAFGPYLAGRTPVGIDIDRMLSYLDYELKRHNYVVSMPIGIDLASPQTRFHNGSLPQTALERARMARELFWQGGALQDSADAFFECEPLPGYLLPRELDAGTFVVGGIAGEGSSLEQDLVHALRELSEQGGLDPSAQSLLRGVETATGQEILPLLEDRAGPATIDEVLVQGAVVCFTGTAFDAFGCLMEREELEEKARDKGLRVEGSVTKSRLTALIVAENGSQSNKAKSAQRFNKPIFTAQEFQAWLSGHAPVIASGPQVAEVQIIELYRA